MKRLFAVLFTALVSLSAFAQVGSKKLIAGVYDFLTADSKKWYVVEPDIQFIDPVLEKIVFTGSFVEFSLGFFEKYDFTCIVVRQGDDFSLEITDLTSLLHGLDMKPRPKAELLTWPKRTREKYAKKMKEEISKRMKGWSEAEYEQKLNDAVTSPIVLAGAARSNNLAFKKFIEEYKVIGRSVTTKIYFIDVHADSKASKGYAYCVDGKGLCGHLTCRYELKEAYYRMPQYADVTFYTNDGTVVSLKPANRKTPVESKDARSDDPEYDVESGSEFTIKGTIKEVAQYDEVTANKIASIVISE